MASKINEASVSHNPPHNSRHWQAKTDTSNSPTNCTRHWCWLWANVHVERLEKLLITCQVHHTIFRVSIIIVKWDIITTVKYNNYIVTYNSFRLHQIYEMQTIAIDDPGVCQPICHAGGLWGETAELIDVLFGVPILRWRGGVASMWPLPKYSGNLFF